MGANSEEITLIICEQFNKLNKSELLPPTEKRSNSWALIKNIAYKNIHLSRFSRQHA